MEMDLKLFAAVGRRQDWSSATLGLGKLFGEVVGGTSEDEVGGGEKAVRGKRKKAKAERKKAQLERLKDGAALQRVEQVLRGVPPLSAAQKLKILTEKENEGKEVGESYLLLYNTRSFTSRREFWSKYFSTKF